MDFSSNRLPEQGWPHNRGDSRSPAPLHTQLPPAPSLPKTAHSTPMSSPGLFSPTGLRHAAGPHTSLSESTTPSAIGSLHPLQSHRVRETHKANIDNDNITGRKSINQYEVIEEIGRGMHGKVKLARNQQSGDNVAIKIIPRFSKKRRLGKLSGLATQDKTKKEIAILKKIRHPNVVALLEVIDDPELKKIYMVLEHVELGEIVWRKKGLPHICSFERRRIEREMRGEPPSAEEEKYLQLLERRQRIKQMKRERMAQHYPDASNYWSVEHGAADEASSYGQQSRIASQDDFAVEGSNAGSRSSSRAPTRTLSNRSMNEAPFELDEDVEWDDDMETPGPLRSNPASSAALEANSFGVAGEGEYRGRSPSMADSIISHMSSIDFRGDSHDTFVDDFSYVPCFTFQQARSTFQDTVLGLEYLHYQGVVHRDIKPANLLWTKEHRVKISDFGVSYFGRPIRDGDDADDTVSESEALDFDDDLELAKTVGTPAFFAPELCYTDVDQEQPKISEQIDVWSLGVTLYCLIFARIPFLADDEFQMFRKIATEEVYIPNRRLKPVDPSTSPAVSSLYKRQNLDPYRDDNDLEYEDVDSSLIDLLQQMLIKNPEKRIRLRDIKRHPWVTSDLTNIIGWLDDSDPARPTEGRKIQVDEKDMSFAVVPLAMLERARTMTRKVLNKVMHPLGDRGDSRSRHRATSSAASSAGDSMINHGPTTPGQRTDRRRSILPDDYFTTAIQDSLAQSDAAVDSTHNDGALTPNQLYDPMATVMRSPGATREHLRSGSAAAAFENSAVPSRTVSSGHRHGHSVGGRIPRHGQHLWMPSGRHTTPATPLGDLRTSSPALPIHAMPQLRDVEASQDDLSRSRSMDRGLFVSTDKRAQAQVSVSTAAAPGNNHTSTQPHASETAGQSVGGGLASPPRFLQQRSDDVAAYQHNQPHSDPSIHSSLQAALIDGPHITQKAQRGFPLQGMPIADPEHFAHVQASQYRRHQQEIAQSRRSMHGSHHSGQALERHDLWSDQHGLPSRTQTATTVQSSSTESMDVIGTPLTSPSDITSPVSVPPAGKRRDEMEAVFRSDPSLPALLSGASSVSADMEAELLGRPGIVGGQHSILLESTDSLTPPALMKEPPHGFPMQEVFSNPPAMDSGSLAMHLHGAPIPRADDVASLSHLAEANDGDDEDDSGSDDGLLLIAKPKKKAIASHNASSSHSPFEPRRRDTNASIMSTDTAKKVRVDPMTPDEQPIA